MQPEPEQTLHLKEVPKMSKPMPKMQMPLKKMSKRASVEDCVAGIVQAMDERAEEGKSKKTMDTGKKKGKGKGKKTMDTGKNKGKGKGKKNAKGKESAKTMDTGKTKDKGKGQKKGEGKFGCSKCRYIKGGCARCWAR